MDATTLYMLVTFANSGHQAHMMEFRFETARQCQESARDMAHGRIAEHYRRQGNQVKVYCGPPQKPLVIAR